MPCPSCAHLTSAITAAVVRAATVVGACTWLASYRMFREESGPTAGQRQCFARQSVLQGAYWSAGDRPACRNGASICLGGAYANGSGGEQPRNSLWIEAILSTHVMRGSRALSRSTDRSPRPAITCTATLTLLVLVADHRDVRLPHATCLSMQAGMKTDLPSLLHSVAAGADSSSREVAALLAALLSGHTGLVQDSLREDGAQALAALQARVYGLSAATESMTAWRRQLAAAAPPGAAATLGRLEVSAPVSA
jgi:hypothetical protein